MLDFKTWLKGSNEAKPFRDAFELIDQMPMEFKLKSQCFYLVHQTCENQWQKTKQLNDT